MIDEVLEFLRTVPPFQFLDEAALRELAADILQDYYPKGTMILSQDGPPSDHLLVVLNGGVKVFLRAGDRGEEDVIDYRTRGEVVGFMSLFSGDRSRSNALAVEDTTCYLLPRDAVLRLLDAHEELRAYFHRTFLAKYMEKTFSEMRSRSLLSGGGEKPLFTTPVGEMASREVITAPQEITIRGAAEAMSRHHISSLVLTADDGSPSGIVTDRDLRDKVAAKARDTGEPAAGVMSATLIKSESAEYCFEALLKMTRHNIHHLLVVEGGRLIGIVTNHDLMLLQGTSPLSVVRAIESQQGLDGLSRTARKTDILVGLLLQDGARAGSLARIIAEVNDRVVRKAAELVARELGTPPAPWCWLGLGSEGRREQTFRTDQDNALVYEAPPEPGAAAAAQEYFGRFARRMSEYLERCGFAPCPAGCMAANPQWTQPLETWRRTFTEWIARPHPEALLHSLIFFDFRPVAGEVRLAEQLRDHLLATLGQHQAFLGFMAGTIVRNRPPLGLFHSFVVEKEGEHKDTLNIKVKGLAPLVDLARLFGLEKGLNATGTVERIRELRECHTLVAEFAEEFEQAFEFLMLLRIHHQYRQVTEGAPPDNYIQPERLSHLERKSVKDAFRLIGRIQDQVIERYRASVW